MVEQTLHAHEQHESPDRSAYTARIESTEQAVALADAAERATFGTPEAGAQEDVLRYDASTHQLEEAAPDAQSSEALNPEVDNDFLAKARMSVSEAHDTLAQAEQADATQQDYRLAA